MLASKCLSNLSPCLLSCIQVRISTETINPKAVLMQKAVPDSRNFAVWDYQIKHLCMQQLSKEYFSANPSKPFFEFIPAFSTHSTLLQQVPQCTDAQGKEPPAFTCCEAVTCYLLLILSGSWGMGYRWKVIILYCLLTCHCQ